MESIDFDSTSSLLIPKLKLLKALFGNKKLPVYCIISTPWWLTRSSGERLWYLLSFCLPIYTKCTQFTYTVH